MKRHPKRTIGALGGVLLTGAVIIAFCVLIFLLKTGYSSFYQSMYPTEYNDLVETYAHKNDLPLSLVYAVIRTESRFKPNAESNVGARGLMQLMEEAFDWVKYRMNDERELSFDDMYDPEYNIEYGTFMLRLLLEEFGDTNTALCAYHAGWGSVKGWLADENYSEDGVTLKVIPFAETDNYVLKVGEARKYYQELYDFA